MKRGLQRPRNQAVAVDPDPALRCSLAYLLAATGDSVRLAAHKRLADVGLLWPQHLMLAVLARLDGLSQQTLASRTGVDRSTVASSLADLEHEGAVARERDFADGRMLRASLTTSGRALAEKAARATARAEREGLRALSQRDRERLADLLARALPQPSLLWWLRQG